MIHGKGARAGLYGLTESPSFAQWALDPLARGVELKLCKSLICDEPYTAATGMAIFGDDAHVKVIHKGTFNAMVSMASLRVEKGRDWSAQFVKWGGIGSRVSPEYAEYIELVTRECGERTPEIGAIWLAYGANTTIEFYQWGPNSSKDYLMVLSTYIPKGKRTDIAIEVYTSVRTPPQLIEAFWRAYMKTANSASRSMKDSARLSTPVITTILSGRWASFSKSASCISTI